MADFNRAKTLIKSIRYPTFQFWATANNDKLHADKQLVISALTSLEWLRTKFSEFDIPKELDMPSWENYKSVSIVDLMSVHINEGYALDIVCLPELKAWSLRLIEPDLGTRIENGVKISTAVPGRIFQTEIAFTVVGGIMQCGVKITISEPDGLSAPCKAYRPYLVQVLVENPLLDFRCGYPIGKDVWNLSKSDRVKQLRDYLSSGNIPAVIMCDYAKTSEPDFPPRLIEKNQVC